jgi:hypothetical protein
VDLVTVLTDCGGLREVTGFSPPRSPAKTCVNEREDSVHGRFSLGA